jgi:prevent-host-death family protein
MFQADDIHSLTDFQRNARKYISQLRKSGRAQVLTVNGRATITVMDAKAYEKLAAKARRLEEIEALQEGVDDIDAGNVVRSRPRRSACDPSIGRHQAAGKAPEVP